MKRKMHYYPHRGHSSHPSSLVFHLGRFLLPLGIVVLFGLSLGSATLLPDSFEHTITVLLYALLLSLARLFGAFFFALVLGIAFGMLAEKNKYTESLLLPFFDVLESLPVLAFFPVLILFFLHSGWVEGAALFIIFFSMVWNITFSVVGGLKVIPQDIKAVGKVFGLTPWERFTKVTLPALFPPIVTGSILSLANGWNVIIVAEVLHAYAPTNSGLVDLSGIGSVLVQASASGNTNLLLGAMALLVVVIAVINMFVWQPLLARAEQYRFE